MTKRTSPYSPTYNKFDLTSFKKNAISADTRIDFTVDNQQPKQVGNRLIKNSEKKQKQKEEEGDNQQLANKKITSFEEHDKENQTPSVLNQTKLSSYSLTFDSKVDNIPDNILDSMIGNSSTRSISPPKRLGFENDNNPPKNSIGNACSSRLFQEKPKEVSTKKMTLRTRTIPLLV